MNNPTNPQVGQKRAFDTWMSEARAAHRQQAPAEELLAEHYVMTGVLLAMEAEARTLLAGESIRIGFWADLIDFNGNFVHLCHRVKEESFIIPAMVENKLLGQGQVEAIQHEHGVAKDMTLAIRDGVEEGDWEKVHRLVMLYLHFLPAHMKREEESLLALARTRIAGELARELRAAFDDVDRRALAERGRVHYVGLARRMTESCGIEYDLGPERDES